MKISVIISSYNPELQRLRKVLHALYQQTLSLDQWELIIIDNASTNDTLDKVAPELEGNSRIVHEHRQGLTYARIKGFTEASGELIVMVDDDNVLDKDYLKESLRFLSETAHVGAIGGKSLPIFESEPPAWIENFYGNLALRDLGNRIIISDLNAEVKSYPDFAPIGAGMVVRKEALSGYMRSAFDKDITDRKGSALFSSGDNDIVIEILKAGWEIAYSPSLSLQHIITANRLKVEYLSRLSRDTMISWIKLLNMHGICPWPVIPKWSVLPRKIKSYFLLQAWKGDVNYIKWKGSCGMYEGLAEINKP